MNKPTIRQAVFHDLEDIVKIDSRCFPPGIAYPKAEFRYYLTQPNTETFVAETEHAMVGFLVATIEGVPRKGTLVTLDVIAEHRQAGIGSALLARAEQSMLKNGVRDFELQVDTGNQIAIRFYRRRGFRMAGKLVGYYPTGSDAYLMIKKLITSSE